MTIETIGAPMTLTDQQAHTFARSIFSEIRRYCEEHKDEFEEWQREQEHDREVSG